ncbi:MAG: hypothetical protein DCC58_00465 [Chloroflexi bacterium]|nr:MAG: hypothetical protein DCC58_00465 [Chloroflexota bacterium]
MVSTDDVATAPHQTTGDAHDRAAGKTPQGWELNLPENRQAGSCNEQRAARVVMDRFHAVAIPSLTLTGRAPGVQHYAELVILPMLLAALLIGLFLPFVAAVLVALILALYAAETAGEGLIARVVPQTSTTSVLAAVPAQRQNVRTLILVAPLDTLRRGRVYPQIVAPLFSRLERAVFAAGLLAGGTPLLRAVAVTALPTWFFLLPAAVLLALLLLVADRSSSTDADPTSNAEPQISTLMQLATEVRAHPARWVDIWGFVAGAGSISGVTLAALLRENNLAPESTFIVNLQVSPTHTPTVALAEGPLWKRRAAPTLTRHVAGSGAYVLRERLTETTLSAMPLAQQYQAVTLGLPLSTSTSDAGAIDAATQRLRAFVDAIDHDILERQRVTRLAQRVDHRSKRLTNPPRM